ncbi:sensor histidine kinase [Jidongwangia harbinensis]|uniref:sensor histidine kinase n=1 Tax=Jidongwangia harbinensis TaxID=2878561 RepID=UPI001CDA27EC|nr:sensor histidine kinase [Jidongwangia harbinensis]MCA2215978.1 sensor histidine kinase [Jidongwangia harbinensis]
MVGTAPPLRWMASTLYAAVLGTGLYYQAAGLAPGWSPAALGGFVAGLLGLLAIEQIPRPGPGVRRLAARVVLLGIVAACDATGFGGALAIVMPFFAYFALGRRWSLGLAAAYLLVGVLRTAGTPGWSADPERISDLLMLFIGMVITVATAAVAVEQHRSRMHAERLVAELSAAQRRVAELSAAAERHRMARDLHDSFGHHLTAISVQLAKAQAFRDRDPAVADRAVGDASQAASRALREVRESVSALRTEPFSLVTAVTALAGGLDDADFRVSVECSGSESGHPRAGLEALYRVAQEALTNARRHAGADLVRVALRFADAAVLEVADNGRGFRTHEVTGSGLAGMRERLAALGGRLAIDSAPGRGTRVTARVGGS